MASGTVLRILHTSDWHLGCSLYGKKRYAECASFLTWLADYIRDSAIDILLVAGDIFDTTTPSNRSQELYYRFLCRIAAEGSCQVVITAGNHDSPSFLQAPKELLRVLRIHVVSEASGPDEEILLLRDSAGEPCICILAVPYLRDRDVRESKAGELPEEKEARLGAGIAAHYAELTLKAEAIVQHEKKPLPILAMGHLFTRGGITLVGDGVRELYVGKLAHVPTDIFPKSIAYVALGHLHIPQTMPGNQPVRYCGSPIPMGFNEASQSKELSLITISESLVSVESVPIPRWQELKRIHGDLPSILSEIDALLQSDANAWLEITYEGEEWLPTLRDSIVERVEHSSLEVLQIRNAKLLGRYEDTEYEEELENLSPKDVFERCLDAKNVPYEQRPPLRTAYTEIVNEIEEDDKQAE